MDPFTSSEYADMHYVYGFCSGNASESVREYIRRFPDRRIPDRKTFIRVHQCLRENGRFPTNGRLVGNFMQDVGLEEVVLERVSEDPRISTRTLAREFGVSQTFVSKLLRKEGLHPFHFKRVQKLDPRDPPQRLQFCQWIRQHDRRDFLKTILWTDECSFTRDGVFNFHNEHHYADDNPHLVRESRSQSRFKVNVWAGLIGNRIIGPYVDLPPTLNGVDYLQFLTEILPDLLEDIPLNLRDRIVYQADGAPPHYDLNVRDYLRNNFRLWIGRGGTVAWPPRSPDLNPLDYYFWGYLKQEVYRTPVESAEEVRNRIVTATARLRNTVNLNATVRELRKRVRICIRQNGGHFENLLK